MKREILFRGKRADNGEWIYGDLCRGEGNKHFAISTNSIGLFEVIPETIGQFTGLTDKNGVKIFEGNICRVEYYNHASKNIVKIQEVSFQDGTFVLRSKDIDDSISIEESRSLAPIFWVYPPNKIEIIGNIHDTPELING